MQRLERYLFSTASTAFLISLLSMTGIVWVTGALREISLITVKSQTLAVFFTITSLSLPFFIAAIAPIALLASLLYYLNRLNGDSELIVMSAAGASPALILRPLILLTILVTFGLYCLYIFVIPMSFSAVEALTKRVHADFIANFAKPGAFNTLEDGYIFHYRERGQDGSLRGVFVQDRRNPAAISTFIAEKGDIVEKNQDVYLLLSHGSVQQPARAGDSSLVTFEDYAIDLSQFLPHGNNTEKPRPRNRDTLALLKFRADDVREKAYMGEARAELYDRLTTPLYALAAGFVAFAALGTPRTTRQGRGMAILAAIGLFATIRILGFADSLLVRGKGDIAPPAWSLIAAWGGPAIAMAFSLFVIFGDLFRWKKG